jgi:hypothetical protein
MGNDNFFSEMNQLPNGVVENFNEDEYINKLSSGKIEKGRFGNRDEFQEMIFGTNAKTQGIESQLVVEIENLMTAKGLKQTQQGRKILLEAMKALKKSGVITG